MMFLACFGDNVQAAVGAEYAYKTFGNNAYFLWDKGVEYTTLLGAYFKTRFTELGGTIALEDSYDDKATDFSAQITKIKALSPQPDFYYVAAMPYNIGPLVKQFRDAGITGPIVGGDGYDTPDLVAVAGAAADNVFFTTHALMDATGGTDGIKKFITDYKAEYGNDPENAFAALGYDTVYLLVDAIKRAGSTDSAAVKAAIEATKDFKGITGAITFSADSHVPAEGRHGDRDQGWQIHPRGRGGPGEGARPVAFRTSQPMTPEAIVKEANERGLQLVRFLYCDNGGVIRGKSTHVGQLARRMASGIGLVKGMQSFTSLDFLAPDATYGPVGEIRLVPDPDTFVVLPYAPRSGQMMVNMVELDRSPWALDPRHFLQRMVAAAGEHGPRLRRGVRERVLPRLPDRRRVRARSTGACASAPSGWSRPSRSSRTSSRRSRRRA